MTPTPVLLAFALLACAATLCIGGHLLVRSQRRTPWSRGAILLSIVVGALALMIPSAARSGSQAHSLASPLGQALPAALSMPGEMGPYDGDRRDAALAPVADSGRPKWSLIVERAEQLRSQGDYAQAADTYAALLVSTGGHLRARLGLAKALLEYGRYQEAELHVGRASAIACQDAGSSPELASAFAAVEEIRAEFASRLAGPLTTVQRQRLNAAEQARLTAIWKDTPWRVTISVTDVREVLGELIVEGAMTNDPALRIRVHSRDRSHVQRSVGEQLAMTIVLTRWPAGREAFDAREIPPGLRAQSAIGPRDIPLGRIP